MGARMGTQRGNRQVSSLVRIAPILDYEFGHAVWTTFYLFFKSIFKYMHDITMYAFSLCIPSISSYSSDVHYVARWQFSCVQ